MRTLELYIDGASKGNPGPAGVGVVLCQGREVIKNLSYYIGETTNNIAEYSALIYGLQEAIILKAESVKINTDSELLYRQINREYKVRDAKLLSLYNQALHLLTAFKNFEMSLIPRRDNRGADKLASLKIKEVIKGKGKDR